MTAPTPPPPAEPLSDERYAAPASDPASGPAGAGPTGSAVRQRRRRWLPWPVAVLLAAPLWWGLGFLPWFVHGPGITVPELEGVQVALPLVTEHLTTLVVGSLVGAALAGLPVRLVRPERRVLAGALCAIVVGGVAAYLVVRSHDRIAELGARFGSDPRVLDGLVVGMVVVMAAAVPLTLLVAAAPRPIRGIALAGSSVLATSWLVDLCFRRRILTAASPFDAVVDLAPWIGAVLLGLALAYTGWRTVGRAVAWLLGLALAWVAASLTVATLSLGTSLTRSVDDSDGGISTGVVDAVDGAVQAFTDSLHLDSRRLAPWVLAAVLGLVLGAVWDQWRARRDAAGSARP